VCARRLLPCSHATCQLQCPSKTSSNAGFSGTGRHCMAARGRLCGDAAVVRLLFAVAVVVVLFGAMLKAVRFEMDEGDIV